MTAWICRRCGEALPAKGAAALDPVPQVERGAYQPSYMHPSCAVLERAELVSQLALDRKRLADAAPDMLAALKTVESWLIPGMSWQDEIGLAVKQAVRQAIVKAEGGNT